MGYKEFKKGSHKREEYFGQQHRFEHWYVDNQVYFITARVRGRFSAFDNPDAQAIFWERLDHYLRRTTFVPWIISLLSNHYHILGYLKAGEDLPDLMKGLHGSVSKLVNDVLPIKVKPFWVDSGHQSYFDGCIRDELQARRAYRYTLTQCRRHGICHDPTQYLNTRKYIDIDRAIRRSHELGAFLEEVPYKRYQKHIESGGRTRWDE
jgi:hypothetical protein